MATVPGGHASGTVSALVGREPEQAAAAAFLDAAARGPAAFVIAGPAGIGKTSLWRAVIADATRRGYRTAETRAVEAEAQLAFGGLADLLDPWIDEVIDVLPPAQRTALEVALHRIPAEGTAPPPLAASLGTLAATRALAARTPLIIAVDDLGWLDAPSARILEYVTRRLGDARVGFTATVRADTTVPPAAAGFDGRVDRLDVGPLDLGAIDALVRQGLGLTLRRPALAWIHAGSGGNPFVALEMARAIQRGGIKPGLEGLAVPTAPTDLVRGRLDALPASCRLPLAAVAALGNPPIRLVAAAIPGSDGAIETARLGGVVEVDADRVLFTHPLLAAGAYGLLEPTERRRLHARLAEIVAEPEQHARHLALAAEAPDEWVAAELDRAAAQALSQGASDAAADLELQAARLTPDDDPAARLRRTVAAGAHLIRAGDPTRARVVLEHCVADAPHGPGRADALIMLADARSSDDWQAKIHLLDEALLEVGTDHRLRSRILQALAQTNWHTVRDARGGLALASASVIEADLQDDPVARCSAYLAAVHARLAVGEGLSSDLLERAMALEPFIERERVFLWPSFTKALADADCDRLDAAIATLLDLRIRAADMGDWDSLPLVSGNLADVTFRRGTWRDALGHAADAERGSRQNGQDEALSLALSLRAVIETALGNEVAGREAAEEGLAIARQVHARASELNNRAALGFLALSAGDPRTAEDELRQAVVPWLEEGYVSPVTLVWLPSWAEALVALDRIGEAASLVDLYEPVARRLDHPSARAACLRVRGLVAASAGDQAGAASRFADAYLQHDRVPEPFQRGRTLLAEGECLRRSRQRGRARDALAAAATVFEGLGARRWHERAMAGLARTGHRETGSSLTRTERQVADLVAAGRTNREVAETLFMSVHTVEAHLTRIYRSLGIRSRTELARAMTAQPRDRLDDRADDRPDDRALGRIEGHE